MTPTKVSQDLTTAPAPRNFPRRDERRHPCILVLLLQFVRAEEKKMDGPEVAEEADGMHKDEAAQAKREG